MTNARGGINVTAEYTPHWAQELIHSEARFKVMCRRTFLEKTVVQ